MLASVFPRQDQQDTCMRGSGDTAAQVPTLSLSLAHSSFFPLCSPFPHTTASERGTVTDRPPQPQTLTH